MQPPARTAHTFKIGFTGTQAGMNLAQKVQVAATLDSLDPEGVYEFHHGCCEGADEEFHNLVRSCNLPNAKIIGHPGHTTNKTSSICLFGCDDLMPQLANLKRNHKIIESVDELWATPRTIHEVRRSGTWATIRYADKANVPARVFFPDGVILMFNVKGVEVLSK